MGPSLRGLRLPAVVGALLVSTSIGEGEDYSQWAYSRTIVLNTTSAGADVAETVVDFPVLLRLDPGTFTGFAATSPGGADLRFAKPDGTHLPYEIERWVDGAGDNDTAQIWVLVDTVHGNATTDVHLYWGNASASDSSCASCVFDTANGFVGVYHLSDDPGGDAAGAIRDATHYGNHGTSAGGMTASNLVGAAVGTGLDFEHDNHNYVTLANENNFDITTTITLSAWVTIESWSAHYMALLAKRDRAYRIHGSSTMGRLCVHTEGLSATTACTEELSTAQSYHIVGRYSGSHLSCWANGVKSESASTGTIESNNYPVTVGRNPVENERDWDGVIDEVRIEKVARSDAWVRVCYMNQRADQRLVDMATPCMPPAISSHPHDQNVVMGEDATFSVTATGTALAYQWQTDSTGTWTDMAGETAATYDVTATSAMDGDSVRVVVTGDCGAATSDATVLNVISRPANPLALTATELSANEVALSWTGDADSVRIWYGTAQVPLSHDVSDKQFTALYPHKGVTRDTLTTLNASTVYYFGAQVYRDGLWSAVTQKASAQVTTLAATGQTITNELRIDSVTFDQATNRILVTVTLDGGSSLWSERPQVGIGYSLEGPPEQASAIDAGNIHELEQGTATTTLPVKPAQECRFDTTYYLGVWLRTLGGPWADPTDSSRVTIRTPSATWQAVSLFAGADTADTVLNDAVVLRRGDRTTELVDTLRVYTPATDPEGLVIVGTGVTFVSQGQHPPFAIGLRFDSLPSGLEGSEVRIYRDSGGVFLVDHDSYRQEGIVWTTTGDLSFPLVAAVDTVRPTVVIESDTGAVLAEGDDALLVVRLADNIANPYWSLAYPGAPTMAPADTHGVLAATPTTVRCTLAASAIPRCGLAAVLTVSDAVHTTEHNVSRRVARSVLDTIRTVAGAVAPVRVTGVLDDSSFETVFETVSSSGGTWTYDRTKIRAYRWSSATSTQWSHGSWQEYAASSKAAFRLVPGRLLWVCTMDDMHIPTGPGVTVSLKENYSITLAPGCWTDLAVPFGFAVRLGEVLDETAAGGIAADSLQVIRWVKSGGTYHAHDVFAGVVPSLRLGRDSALAAERSFAYSVYNPWGKAVDLAIPPTPAAMSPLGKRRPPVADGEWDIAVRSRLDDGSELNAVRCGVSSRLSHTVYLPERPGFGSVRVQVMDSTRRRGWAHAMAPAMRDGGVSFRLKFRNRGASDRVVHGVLDGLERVPAGMSAALFHGQSISGDDSTALAIDVPAGGETHAVVGLGTHAYVHDIAARMRMREPRLLGAFPNPFRTGTRIRFALPSYRLRAVYFEIYDVHGKRIRHTRLTRALHPGEAVFVWDGVGTDGGSTTAGVYVVRMRAVEMNGTVRQSSLRLTRLR